MSPAILSMLFLFAVTLILNVIRLFLKVRPGIKKVEKPDIIQRLGIGGMGFLLIFSVLFTLLSIVTRVNDAAFMFSLMTLLSAVLYYFTRRKFKRYYMESEDSFFLDGQYVVNRVHYDDISDWIPLKKQIGVLDETQAEDTYIVVNLVFHDPEILLRKLTEMTFAGKFKQTDPDRSDDPNREDEWIKFLEKNGYGHILEDYEQVESNS